MAEKVVLFGDGLKFPWGRPGRLWNILWVLVPIVGWLALGGYFARIVKSIVKGNVKDLPEFGGFGENIKSGFMLFVRLLPLWIIIGVINVIPVMGWIFSAIFGILMAPYLTMNVIMKERINASFEWDKAWKAVTGDLSAYLLAWIKTLGYCAIYFLACFILIGIPCLAFGSYIFYSNWFAKNWKK